MGNGNQYLEDSYSLVSTRVFLPITHTQLQTVMPNTRGDLQNVINVLCNKVSIFLVIWSRMTFTVIGTAALKSADQSTDYRQACWTLSRWCVWSHRCPIVSRAYAPHTEVCAKFCFIWSVYVWRHVCVSGGGCCNFIIEGTVIRQESTFLPSQ